MALGCGGDDEFVGEPEQCRHSNVARARTASPGGKGHGHYTSFIGGFATKLQLEVYSDTFKYHSYRCRVHSSRAARRTASYRSSTPSSPAAPLRSSACRTSTSSFERVRSMLRYETL